jgi:hypothetical protein
MRKNSDRMMKAKMERAIHEAALAANLPPEDVFGEGILE